jgi:hypothetical protein
MTGRGDHGRHARLIRALDGVQGGGAVGQPGKDVQLEPWGSIEPSEPHRFQGEGTALGFKPVRAGNTHLQEPENDLAENIVGL